MSLAIRVLTSPQGPHPFDLFNLKVPIVKYCPTGSFTSPYKLVRTEILGAKLNSGVHYTTLLEEVSSYMDISELLPNSPCFNPSMFNKISVSFLDVPKHFLWWVQLRSLQCVLRFGFCVISNQEHPLLGGSALFADYIFKDELARILYSFIQQWGISLKYILSIHLS